MSLSVPKALRSIYYGLGTYEAESILLNDGRHSLNNVGIYYIIVNLCLFIVMI